MLQVVVLISGSGSNARALLEAAQHPLFPARIAAIGSDRAADGLAHADLFGVPTFVVDPKMFPSRDAWALKLADNISHFDPDLVVLAGFMKVLPKIFVDRFSPNLINTHPSLLPAFPGAHAVRDALAAGVGETGVTVHLVDEGVDTGPILAQQAIPILPGDSAETLHERIKQSERQLLVETVRAVAEGKLQLQRGSGG
jgi:phosphoribosylglycinamide formyltransferase 1